VLARGRIVAAGTPAALIAGARAAMRVVLETTAPLEPAWLAGADNPVCEGTHAHFATDDLTGVLAALAPVLAQRGIAITALKAGRASLEDVILQLTDGAA
jgi:hypothetical protein